MPRRSFMRMFSAVALMGLAASLVSSHAQDSERRGRKYKAPAATSRIEVTILRDVNGKPIENAAVIFHPMVGEKDEGNMELKTNEDGKTIIDVLPLGDTVRLQIIARGFQTFGQDYKIDKPEMAIEVRMKRPGQQYSTYKQGDQAKSPDSGKSEDSGAPKSAAKPADNSNTKPAPPQTR